MMPFEMESELRSLLRGRDFAYYAMRAVVGKTTILEILVSLESDDAGDALLARLGMPNGYTILESRLWPLNCCWSALKRDTEVWIESVGQRDGEMVFRDRTFARDLQLEMERLRDDRAW